MLPVTILFGFTCIYLFIAGVYIVVVEFISTTSEYYSGPHKYCHNLLAANPAKIVDILNVTRSFFTFSLVTPLSV